LQLDPITFEVIKHRLWQINDEQAVTIRTVSASPIVVEGNDFNTGLFTRHGDLVIAGPGSLVHVTTIDTAIKSIISMAREFEDGDAYLTNDPYLGALHQNDLVVASPLFYEGELVMWVGNVLHHADVGGIDEGSFCINAVNIYQEPPLYFLKVVDKGRLQPDVEYTFMRNSRLPDTVALDLRAQVGALHVVKNRLTELLREKGVETVLEVMERSVDYAEEKLRQRFAEIPDGAWDTEVYMDGDKRGCTELHRVFLRLEKRGEELFFDYTGSDAQVEGGVNSTYHACYAGTAVPIYTFICNGEIDWNSGLKRVVHVEAPEGTVMNARYPAAVSICTLGFRWLATVASMRVLAKMLSASEKYRDRVCPSWTVSSNGTNVFATNRRGKRVGALLSDHRGGGAGARSFADGFDNAGMVTSYLSFMANVESQEWKLPILHVFRKQLIDSGGPGAFRGGLSLITAFTAYGAERLIFKNFNTAGTNQSNAAGIDGGYPGSGSQATVIRGSRIRQILSSGQKAESYEDFGGTVEHLLSKSDGILGPDDVFVFYSPGGGGYGDPLQRDTRLVQDDVRNGRVSPESARRRYGVVLQDNLEVDAEATKRLREAMIHDRLAGSRSSAGPLPSGSDGGDKAERIGEYLERISLNGRRLLRCRSCHCICSETGESEGERILIQRAPLSEAGPWLALRWQGNSPDFVLLKSICPGCGILFDVSETRTQRGAGSAGLG
jgi:N-methylhydantoinase B